MEKKISVIIPIYNTAKYIIDCLKSIKEQTYKSFEIILVDDGSTDNSMIVAKEYLKDCENDTIFISQDNKGVAAARNNGILHANGDWIIAIDSDDYLDKETFKIAMDHVRDEEIIAIDFIITNEKSRSICVTNKNIESISGIQAFKDYFLRKRKFISPGMLIRKSFLLSNNITYDEGCRFAEDDIYVWKNLCFANRILHIKKPLYCYYLHQNSTMTTSNIEKFYTVKNATEALDEKIQISKNSQKYKHLFLIRHYLGIMHVVAKLQTFYD